METKTDAASQQNPDSVKQESSTQTGHTPAPWNVKPGTNVFYITGYKGYLAKIIGDTIEDQANARLIAAAPALLEACQMVVRLVDAMVNNEANARAMPSFDNGLKQIESAIALATGKDAANDTN